MPFSSYTPKAFICGTQKDQESERAIASRECINRGVLPLGMELFPAVNQAQWAFIKANIDLCDFMIVILSGRYGTINNNPGADNSLSFTHNEYRYALGRNIPVVALIKDMTSGEILDANMDMGQTARRYAKSMEEFRKEVLSNGFLSRIWGKSKAASSEEFTAGVALTIDTMRSDCLKRHHENYLKTALVTQHIRAKSTAIDFDHSQLIRSSKEVRIVMNDGFRFFERYRSEFVERARQDLGAEVCLLAPEGAHVPIIARRSEKEETEQTRDILISLATLKEFSAHSVKNPFKLFVMENFFPYCLFKYDDIIIISLYLAFKREEQLPLFVFEKTETPSDIYFTLLKNTDRLFRRAANGDAKWFPPLP